MSNLNSSDSSTKVRLKKGDALLPAIIEGISPEVTLTPVEAGVQMTVTTKSGTKTALIPKGEKGDNYTLTPENIQEIGGMFDSVRQTAEAARNAASGYATAAGQSATAAGNSASTASAQATLAGQARTDAETAQGAAEAAQEAAETAQEATEQLKDDTQEIYEAATRLTTRIESLERDAMAAKIDAEDAATAAAASQYEAALSADAAASLAGTAETHAREAQEAASDAAGAAGDAATMAGEADASATAAAESATAAAGSASQAAQTVAGIESAGAAQVALVEAKGEEVLDSIPADYSELSGDVSTLNSDLQATGVTYTLLSDYPVNKGSANPSSGNWIYTTGTKYKHIIIPITAGDVIDVSVGSNGGNIAFLTDYTTPADGNSLDFSSAQGFTGVISVSANSTVKYTAPSDAVYLYCTTLYNNKSYFPTGVTINGFDIAKTVPGNISAISLLEKELQGVSVTHTNQIQDIQQDIDFVLLQTRIARGSLNSSFVWQNCSDNAVYTFYHAEVPVSSGDRIVIIANTAKALSYAIFLKEFSPPVNDNTATPSEAEGYTDRKSISNGLTYEYVVPSDCNYLYILTTNNKVDVTPQQILVNGVDITKSIKGNLELLHDKWETDVSWCAMGDSITSGYYSKYVDEEPATRFNPKYCYPTLISETNHWALTNIGVGGAGYLIPGSGGSPRGYEIARATDFTPFNLVTIAYGTNDWSNDSAMGSMSDDPTAQSIASFIPAMRATIEAIIASNPNCKIIVILPFNRKKNGNPPASEETNWALGYELSNTGTLESFVQKMIEVCDYYGIQYIDMTHYSVINRKNIPTVLPDGTHPTIECHAMLARELAKKITFGL